MVGAVLSALGLGLFVFGVLRDLEAALDEAGVSSRATDAALDAYSDARTAGLRSALAIRAIVAILALFLASRIPVTQPGATAPP